MKSILWFQPAKLSDNDIITHNGIILQANDERNEYFRELNSIADKVVKKRSPWCGNIGDYFFIKGCLNATDEKGRTLSFMFACDDEKNFRQALNMELEAIGYGLNEETKTCLNSKKKIIFKYCVIAILILSITIAIFCLFK